MKKLIILCLTFLFFSCTMRTYDVQFNYYVGNDGLTEIQTTEKIDSKQDDKKVVIIPPGSGNLTIYIQAEVPKHIETAAQAELSTPLIGR